jgi:nicotinamide-nucleotide amidase
MRGLEEVIGARLLELRKTLAVAESCTAGLLGGRLTEIPGASRYFLGGIIAYDNRVKEGLLGIPKAILSEHGAVSAETAEAMAEGVRKAFKADYGLSITGIAGPDGGSEEKPVGTVYVGLATGRRVDVLKHHLGVDRGNIRDRSVTAALDLLRYELFGLKRPKM